MLNSTPRLWPRLCIPTLLLSATALSSCAVGPNYRAPPSPLAAHFNAAGDLASRTATLPAPTVPSSLDQWWAGFDDPLLSELVEQALAQNLDIAAAGVRVDQARAAARAAGAALLPVGQTQASAARQRQSLESPSGKLFSQFPGYHRTGELYDLNLGASWEIDLFGQLRRNAEAVHADAAAAEAGRAGARLTIAAETADTYLQIISLQQRIRIIGELAQAQSDIAALTAQRADAGAASDSELQAANAQAADARSNLPLLQAGLEAQTNRLDVLLGQRPGEVRARLAGHVTLPKTPPIAADVGPADLLRRRPDIIAAERRLAAENARVGVAMADYWPKLTLSGLLGFESTATGQLLKGPAQMTQGSASGAWRLFDFGRVDAEVKAARGRKAEALLAWKAAVLRADEEAEDALVALVRREAATAEQTSASAAYQATARQAEAARQAGVASRIDALQSQSRALQAQDRLVDSQTESTRSAVAAFRALGGGWTPPDRPPAP